MTQGGGVAADETVQV